MNGWSANTDHPWLGYDYFNLARCALAVRFGTNPFTSHIDYVQYGPWATNFASFPTLCVLAVPLSYLPPWAGFWLLNSFNLLLHLMILALFGIKIIGKGSIIRDSVLMFFAGFFMPWYVLYYQGQYHSVSILAVTLVLAWSGKTAYQVAGFVMSALSKPVLAPASLILFIRYQWKTIIIIGGILVLTFMPWFFMCYDVKNGLSFCINNGMLNYMQETSIYSKFNSWRWNQELTLSAALGEFLTPSVNLTVRYVLTTFIAIWAAFFIGKRAYIPALCLSLMCFFTMYARGFEYYYTLFVPILLSLYTEPDGRYRNWWIVFIMFGMASPTAWVIYKYYYNFLNPMIGSGDIMFNTNMVLYYLFLWQKPFFALLLSAVIITTEWPWQRVLKSLVRLRTSIKKS
ncbi:MAG: hypothetical protein L3V56_03295 [Candidatus Magnetoovum sp. WYHC-5]|nr:hypothetical protein [Candidatus Magnetoovum sp. WYHC-5]